MNSFSTRLLVSSASDRLPETHVTRSVNRKHEANNLVFPAVDLECDVIFVMWRIDVAEVLMLGINDL